jgi:hypothetical protein
MPRCSKVCVNLAQCLKHYGQRPLRHTRVNQYIDFCAFWKLDRLCQAHSVACSQYTSSRKSRHTPILPQSLPPALLKGVGFLLVCLPVKLPSKAFLLPCERDARAPSTRCAGNAGVSPAIPTAQEKNLPL